MQTKINNYIANHYTGIYKGHNNICSDIYRLFKHDTHHYGRGEFQPFLEWVRGEQRIFDVAHARCSIIKDLLFIIGEENMCDCLFDEEKAEEAMIHLVYVTIFEAVWSL